jgi:hypothetical protein
MARVSTHIWLMLLLFLFTTALGLFFLNSISPATANYWQFAVLYVAIFLWVFAAMTFLGYVVRLAIWKEGLRLEFLRSARRQGVLLGFLAVLLVLLQAANILNLLTGLLLLAVFLLIELYAK